MKFRVNDMNIRIFFLMTAMTSSSVMFGCCAGSSPVVVSRNATPSSEPEQVISVRNPLLPPGEQEPSLLSSVKTSPNPSSMRLVSASGSRNDLPNAAGSNTRLGSVDAFDPGLLGLLRVETSDDLLDRSPVAGQDQQFPTGAQATPPLTPRDHALSACEQVSALPEREDVLRVMFVGVLIGDALAGSGVHSICGVTPCDDDHARVIAQEVFSNILGGRTIQLVKWTPPTMDC
jgi:hypothetical protein